MISVPYPFVWLSSEYHRVRMRRGVSEMDDSDTYLISKKSNVPVSAWLDTVYPTIQFRCQENKTNVILIADTRFAVVIG